MSVIKRKNDRVLKICLLGDKGVGKTSLIEKFVHSKFKHSYNVSIGLDASSKTITLDGITFKLSIHDIGSQERFSTIRHIFYPGVHGVILVFDITRPQTLKNLTFKIL